MIGLMFEIATERFGFLLVFMIILAIFLLFILNIVNKLLPEKSQMNPKQCNAFSLPSIILGLILTWLLIFPVETAGNHVEIGIIIALSTTLVVIFDLLLIKIRTNSSENLRHLQPFHKLIKPLSAMIFSSWIFATVEILAKIFNREITNDFKFGFLWAGFVIFFSIIITIISNRLLNRERRIPSEVLKKAMIAASIITFSIWAIQLIVLNLFALLGPVIVFSLLSYFIVSIIYFVSLFISLFKKYLPEVKNKSVEMIEEWRITHEKEKIKMENLNGEKKVILDVQNLQTYFHTQEGVVRAVENVSFKIYNNEILGLVGETGCGKSVTALSILQLVRFPGIIEGGKIIFDGEDLLQKSKDEILEYRGNRITMMFQDPMNSINPVYTVGNQIEEVFLEHKQEELLALVKEHEPEFKELKTGLKKIKTELKKDTIQGNQSEIDKLDKKEQLLLKKYEDVKHYRTIYTISKHWTINILKDVGIPDPEQFIKRYPHELSGGMRQRIMIAMGLACRPQLLLADEPTTALDVTIQAQILNLMKGLKKKYNTSILFITHDLGVIAKMADRVAVMYSGYVVEYGSVYKLLKDPVHPYTIGLMAAVPRPDRLTKRLRNIHGTVPNLIYPPSGCRFHPRCEYCFKPCSKEVPKTIEIEQDYFVACHLFDPEYKELAQLNKIPNEGRNQDDNRN